MEFSKTNPKEFMDNMIKFKNIREVKTQEQIQIRFEVSLFYDELNIYNFLFYASYCYPTWDFNFFDKEDNFVTDKYTSEDVELEAGQIQKICNENQLKFGMTYLIDERFFMAFVEDNNKIRFFTTNDENGVDLYENINFIFANYLNWAERQFVLDILEKNNDIDDISIRKLAGAYFLIKQMIYLSDEEFVSFYNEEMKWLEKKCNLVKCDKSYWCKLFNEINTALVKKLNPDKIQTDLQAVNDFNEIIKKLNYFEITEEEFINWIKNNKEKIQLYDVMYVDERDIKNGVLQNGATVTCDNTFAYTSPEIMQSLVKQSYICVPSSFEALYERIGNMNFYINPRSKDFEFTRNKQFLEQIIDKGKINKKEETINEIPKNANEDLINKAQKIAYEKFPLICHKKYEHVMERNTCLIYEFLILNNTWFTYDFLVFITKFCERYVVNLFDENGKIVTEKFITPELKLTTGEIEQICEKNHLKLGMTYFNDNRKFNAYKHLDKNEIGFLSRNDESGVNLEKTIESFKYDYFIYLTSKCMSNVLNNSAMGSDAMDSDAYKISLCISYALVEHMLKLNNEQFESFYSIRTKWLENMIENFKTLRPDKTVWEAFLVYLSENILENDDYMKNGNKERLKPYVLDAFGKVYVGKPKPRYYLSETSVLIYQGDDYWHFVTEGLFIEYNMELTFKLKKDCYENEEAELSRIVNILQALAEFTFNKGVAFKIYKHVHFEQMERIDSASKSNIVGFITVPDTSVEIIQTSQGMIHFVELIGITDAEIKSLKTKQITERELYEKIGSDITDYNRKSVVDNA